MEAEALALAPDVDALARAESELANERADVRGAMGRGRDAAEQPRRGGPRRAGGAAMPVSSVARGEMARVGQRLDVLEQKATRLAG